MVSTDRPARRTRTLGLAAAAAAAVTAAAGLAPAAGAAPSTPGLGPLGTATVHGDIYSTDTIPGVGPGAGAPVRSSIPGGTCSSVFVGSDGMPLALCTAYLGTDPLETTPPTVQLLDPDTAEVLTKIQLPKGALLGGVYGYLDDRDRVLIVDGEHRLHAIGHERGEGGAWELTDEVVFDLSPLIGDGDFVTGLAPGTDGTVWFVTVDGIVGTVTEGQADSAQVLDLPRANGRPAPERVSNGITVREGGASVMTSHALYEVAQGPDGALETVWLREYERGPARHPGMLSHGSGSTPTYFGPGKDDYVAFLDSADRSTLFVLDRASGEPVCTMDAFATTDHPGTAASDGVLIDGPAQSENSPIALPADDGRGWSIIMVNTYGFEYMPMAVDGDAVPAQAPYRGGMSAVTFDGADCTRSWTNTTRTATLPKATTGDRLIHGLAYADDPAAELGSAEVPGVAETLATGWGQSAGPVYYSAIDADTGAEVVREKVGDGPVDEPMELTGTIAPGAHGQGVYWQGTVGRMLRIGH